MASDHGAHVHISLFDRARTAEQRVATLERQLAEAKGEVERLKDEAAEMTDGITYNLITHADLQRERDDARADGRREALDLARRILRDWTTNYAPTECLDHDVEELKRRIKEAGGTVMLIANYNAAIRALAPSEKEEDDADAE